MADMTAKAAKNTAKEASAENALHLCYGQIGISAVAAAVRYQGSNKNSAYAPVAIKSDDSTNG
jgi:hypothetical protein